MHIRRFHTPYLHPDDLFISRFEEYRRFSVKRKEMTNTLMAKLFFQRFSPNEYSQHVFICNNKSHQIIFSYPWIDPPRFMLFVWLPSSKRCSVAGGWCDCLHPGVASTQGCLLELIGQCLVLLLVNPWWYTENFGGISTEETFNKNKSRMSDSDLSCCWRRNGSDGNYSCYSFREGNKKRRKVGVWIPQKKGYTLEI